MGDMKNIHKEITIPNRIFLKGFGLFTKEEDITNIFVKYGSIVETKFIKDTYTGQNKGYGFVTFDSQQVAEHVIKTCKSVEFGGVEITVGPAKIRRRPPMSKLFRQNCINQTTFNPQFITPSTPYSVSSDGLFTFYQQPLIIPTTYSPRYPYLDPLVQLDSDTVITSLPQNTNAPTSPDAMMKKNVNISKAVDIPVTHTEPTNIFVHSNNSSPVQQNCNTSQPAPQHCTVISTENRPVISTSFGIVPPPQPVNGFPTNGHLANVNNQLVNVNNHHNLEIKPPSMPFNNLQYAYPPTINGHSVSINGHLPAFSTHLPTPYTHNENVELNGGITTTIPSPTPVSCATCATVLNTDNTNVLEKSLQGLQIDSRAKTITDQVSQDAMENKSLKGQKFLFMSTAPGKVKRVVVH